PRTACSATSPVSSSEPSPTPTGASPSSPCSPRPSATSSSSTGTPPRERSPTRTRPIIRSCARPPCNPTPWPLPEAICNSPTAIWPPGPVAVFLERSARLVVAELAALLAGAPYLPLDPTFPPERLGVLLEGAGAPVVVTREGLRERLPET